MLTLTPGIMLDMGRHLLICLPSFKSDRLATVCLKLSKPMIAISGGSQLNFPNRSSVS